MRSFLAVGLEEVLHLHQSLCLASKKSQSDDTRQCSLGFHKGTSKKLSISLNAGITSSCGICLHPRDSEVSPQNTCENMA
ncbi:hypothetical protein C0J52_20382 [Blattella germanica]|nr:hypothetical protein C0J52_20382 [Blattella germanica]